MPTWYSKAQSDTLLAGKAATAALTALAPLASPAFTGTPTIGGATIAKTSDITAAIANLVGAAPSALDTLKEIDDQLTADEGAAAALAATVAGKVSANASGTANNPVTSATAARPTGLTKVFWQCPTQPTNWVAGDEWINNA